MHVTDRERANFKGLIHVASCREKLVNSIHVRKLPGYIGWEEKKSGRGGFRDFEGREKFWFAAEIRQKRGRSSPKSGGRMATGGGEFLHDVGGNGFLETRTGGGGVGGRKKTRRWKEEVTSKRFRTLLGGNWEIG